MNSDVPEDRLARFVSAHRDVYTSLLALAEELGAEEWQVQTGCPGWTVKDVLSHVVGLEAVMAGDPEPDHELPQDLPHVGNDAGRYMETHVHARRPAPVADLLLEARDVFSRRLGQIEAIVDLEDDVAGVMGSSAPAYRVLPIRVFDLWAHEQDIRRAVGRPGHLRGPAVEITLDRIAKGLALFLGRQDELSGTVVIDVTGEQERVIGVDLDTGELSAVPSPDARITMPFVDLVAHACGRSDAPGPEVVLIEGDARLADMVLDRFAITP